MKILFTALALMIGFLSPVCGAVFGMGSNSLAAQKPTFIATNFATITQPSAKRQELGFDARDRVIGKSFYNANGNRVLLNTGSNAGAVKTTSVNAMRDGILNALKNQPAAP